MRTRQIEKHYDVVVRYICFPLHPDTPDEGLSMEGLKGGRANDPVRKARWAERAEAMRAEGLEVCERTHTYNSRLAQELGKWAEVQTGGEAFHDAVFRAYFGHNRNIARPEVLLDIVQSVGLSVEDARKVLTERSFSKAVDEDWDYSRRLGVTGVPTYVCERAGVVGAQPYEVLEQLVTEAGATRRAGS